MACSKVGASLLLTVISRCFQISHGRLWLLAIIISLATGGISMVLPNVTTIMLMAPVSLKVCQSLEVITSVIPFNCKRFLQFRS